MKLFKLLPLILGCTSLMSCGANKEPVTPPVVVDPPKEPTEVEYLTKFRDDLLNLSKNANTEQYNHQQNNNYSGLDINSAQEGIITRYKNNFRRDNFTQQIEEDGTLTEGVIETGVCKKNNKEFFYNINSFNDPTVDYVEYVEYNENKIENALSVDFSSKYILTSLDLALLNLANPNKNIEISYNYRSIDLTKDTNFTLTFSYIEKEGKIKSLEFTSNDEISISNGKIVSSTSRTFMGLVDSINTITAVRTSSYTYNAFEEYNGEKLNPADFKEKQK